MIYTGKFMEPWQPDEPRTCKLTFIGKNLDHDGLRAAFTDCLANEANYNKLISSFRFALGDAVECNTGEGAAPRLYQWGRVDAATGATQPHETTSLRPRAGSRGVDRAGWVRGTVIKHLYREQGMHPSFLAPYQVKLDEGGLIYVPVDTNESCRAPAVLTPPAPPS